MPYALFEDETEVALGVDPIRAVQRDVKVARYGARRGTQIGLVAALALCAIAACLYLVLRPPVVQATQCLHAAGGFVDVKASCRTPITLTEGGDQLVVYPGASLVRVRDAVRVRHGKASFAAHKRTDGSTLRVHVSHGVIEVTGTRFTVEQTERGGRVQLDEGTIIFHDDDGDDVMLSAGEVLVWPRTHAEVVPEAAPQPALTAMPATKRQAATRTPERTVKPAEPAIAVDEQAEDEDEDEAEEEEEEVEVPRAVLSMEEILQRIATLRQQKRLRDAVALLVSQSQRGDITPAQMARLSWEIGLFIQETSDKETACGHWRRHARSYPDDSTHSERVRALIDACDAAL